MQPGKVLEHAGHGDVSGANDRDFPGEVGNHAAGTQFLPQYMDGNRQRPTGTVLICVSHQLDEDEGQKQRGQKIEGAVLIAGNAIVSAGLLARKLQVDFVKPSDVADILVLKYLEAGTQADDDAAPHTFR